VESNDGQDAVWEELSFVYVRVSKTVLRGKVASAPRKNINNKAFFLHFEYFYE
jgi:hypothetical protein